MTQVGDLVSCEISDVKHCERILGVYCPVYIDVNSRL
jgi:hypothetical protein